MWDFLALIGTLGAPLSFARRAEVRLNRDGSSKVAPVDDWTMRQSELGTHVQASELQRDLWAEKREELGRDWWAATRAELGRDRARDSPPAHEARRQHILGERWARTPYEASPEERGWDGGLGTLCEETRRIKRRTTYGRGSLVK